MTVPERAAETAEALAGLSIEALALLTDESDAALAELVSRASDRDGWEATATELADALEEIRDAVYQDGRAARESARAAIAVFRERKADST
ncbi:MAG: hypothetical protein NUW01_02850 [Gemmatimonadaceae bacterium]|nr:hypothetical protein [Gemmatimonadaceae bacterium]